MLIRTVCILQVSPVVEAWSPTWLHATQKLRELSQRSPRLADYIRRSSLHQFPYFFSRKTRTRRLQPDYWAQIPLEQKLSRFGQTSLPTLSSEAESWAELDRCVSSAQQSIPWGQRF